jgi:predicted RND superfamily exporter protein
MPLVLYLLPKPKIAQQPIESDFWRKQLHKLLLWILRNGRSIAVGTVILLALSFYGITKIQVNNYLIEGLTRKDELRTDFEYFEKNYSGVRPFEILITPKDSTHSLWSPVELRAIDKLEGYLEKDFGVGFMFSPATLVKGVNRVQHGNDNKFYVIPANDSDVVAAVDQIKDYKKAKGEVRKLITKNGSQARLTGKMPDVGSKEFRARSEALYAFVSKDPALQAINVRITGAALMFDKNNQYLVDNTIQGLFLSILVVAIISAIVHRNWRMTLIAIIPNLIPIIIIGGLMGYLGIDMKSATSIIFSIAFGIATDDTIHFLARLRLEMKEGRSVLYCVKRSFLSTGKAVIVTSLILCGGFFSLISSGFESTFYFGLLVSITLFVAVLTDLLLFPLLVIWLIKNNILLKKN